MYTRFSIRTLFVLITFAAAILAARHWFGSHDTNRAVDRFRWHEHANGIATQRWEHGWEYAGEIRGLGSCIVLHHFQPEHERYGQNGGYKVAIQLPAKVAIGDRVVLSPVPPARPGEPQPHDRRYTLMLPGEFTASTFGDHFGCMVARSKIHASAITVKEMTDDHVIVHAQIDVTIPEFYDLKLDRDFVLRRVARM